MLVVAATVTIYLSACERSTAVWIIPGSIATRLEFGLGERKGREKAGHVRALVVQHCGTYGDSSLVTWGVGADGGLPGRITYGVAPDGATKEVDATPLSAGLYLAFTDGTGAAHFVVDSAGAIATIESCFARRRSP